MHHIVDWLTASLLHIALAGACITAALTLWALHDDALVPRSIGIAFVAGPTLGALLIWGLERTGHVGG